MVNPSFWQGKRVLVTGHTGFKGSWLSLWLKLMGAEVNILDDGTGYSVGLMDSEGEICLAERFVNIDAAEHYAKRLAGWFGVRWSHGTMSNESLG